MPTFIFHLPLCLHAWNPCSVLPWRGSHNGCPWLHYLYLFKRNFPGGITKLFTRKAVQIIRQFWKILTFGLLSPCACKKLVFLQVARKCWREYTSPDPDQAAGSNCCFASACYILIASRTHPTLSSVQRNFNAKLILL